MPEANGYRAPRWAWWVATGLGSGRLRPAPGTWGSLAGLLAWCLLLLLGPLPVYTWCANHPAFPHPGWITFGMELLPLLAIGLLTWISIQASDRVVQETGLKDPGFIVADEWVGVWIALWPVRWTATMAFTRLSAPSGITALLIILGIPFLLFRILDIWKPWPIAQVQDLPDGQGIVADDLVAGLVALPLTSLLVPFALQCLH